MDCGWVIPLESDSNDVLNKINYIQENPKEYQEKLKIVLNLKMRSIVDMIKDYGIMYNQCSIAEIKRGKFDLNVIYNGYLLAKEIINDNSQDVQEIVNRVKDLEGELNAIYSSKGYKVLMLFRRLNVPFKSQLKIFILRCYKILKRLKKSISHGR
jgi:hypothetical protein